jgi:hypothetical protein
MSPAHVRLVARGCFLVAAGAVVTAQQPALSVVEEPVPGGAHYAAVGDLDGDGDLDLLAETSALTGLNDGDGRFASGWIGVPAQSFIGSGTPLESPPWKGVVLADLTGDGIADLLQSFIIAPFYKAGLPTGGFSSTTSGSFPGAAGLGTQGLCVGDVDGDADLDVVLATNSGLRLYRNDGAGTFVDASVVSGVSAMSSSAAVLHDLDGDGDLDLVVHATSTAPSPAFVQWNAGGVFGPALALPGTQLSPRLPAVGDFDGDGAVDVIRFGGPDDPVVLARQTTGPAFVVSASPAFAPGAPFRVRDVRGADLDGDGAAEMIVVGDRGVAAFRFVAGAWIEYAPEIPFGGDGLLIFDADQDGDPDCVVAKSSKSTAPRYGMILNDGVGGWSLVRGKMPGTETPALNLNSAAAVFAVDVSSAPVSAVTLAWDGTAFRLERAAGDGHGRFARFAEFPVSGGPTAPVSFGVGGTAQPLRFVAGDFDGDGDDDLAIGNVKMPGQGDQLCAAWLRNDGAAGYVAYLLDADAIPGLFYVRDFIVGDFNGDGVDDLVKIGLETAVYLSAPGAPLTVSNARPPTTTFDGAAGDLDDDGDLDLAFRMSIGGVAVWVNQGDGSFVLGPLFGGAVDGPVDVGDFDGDGRCDVVHGATLFLRPAPLQFVAASTPLPATSDVLRTVLDVDADGDFDLADTAGVVLRNEGASGFSALSWLAPASGPGSVGDVDGDGDADLLRSDGPSLYSNLGRQLVVRGAVRPGYAVDLGIFGPPAADYLLAASTIELTPFASTPYGRLFVDPSTAVVLFYGVLDGEGRAAPAPFLDAASGASLVGTTFVLQAVVGSNDLRLTNARPTLVLPP